MPSIEMTITVWTAVCLAGLSLIIFAALGGGLRISVFRIPQLTVASRFVSGMIGCVLLAIGLYGSLALSLPQPPQPPQPFLQNDGNRQPSSRTKPTASFSTETPKSKPTGSVGPSYIVQAGSFDMATTTMTQVQVTLSKLEICIGDHLKIVSNSDYSFLTPGRWLIAGGPYGTSDAAAVREKISACGAKDALIREIR